MSSISYKTVFYVSSFVYALIVQLREVFSSSRTLFNFWTEFLCILCFLLNSFLNEHKYYGPRWATHMNATKNINDFIELQLLYRKFMKCCTFIITVHHFYISILFIILKVKPMILLQSYVLCHRRQITIYVCTVRTNRIHFWSDRNFVFNKNRNANNKTDNLFIEN